jgi:hypothetical protein
MLKLTVETIRLTQMRISNQKARAYSAIVSCILCIVAGLAIILVGHDRSSSDIDTETETPDFDYKNHQELTLTTDNEKSMSGVQMNSDRAVNLKATGHGVRWVEESCMETKTSHCSIFMDQLGLYLCKVKAKCASPTAQRRGVMVVHIWSFAMSQ